MLLEIMFSFGWFDLVRVVLLYSYSFSLDLAQLWEHI